MVICGGSSGFIASVGISFLLIGLVVYYFNVRLRALERTAQKQNQVLASFIGGVQGGLAQGELRAAATPIPHGGAAPGAIHAAQEALCTREGQCTIGDGQRIPVSDDENEDCDSAGSFTGEDSGSDSESYSDDSDTEGAKEDQSAGSDSVKVIDLGAADETPQAEEAEIEEVLDVEDVTCTEETATTADDDPPKRPAAGGGAETMKVPELRDLVVEKELATAGEARGMKKAQLVALLEPKVESVTAE